MTAWRAIGYAVATMCTSSALVRVLLAASLVLTLVAAPACTKPDPFAADLAMICNAGTGQAGLDPRMQQVMALKEIAGKIKTAEAARLMADLVRAAPSERAALLGPALKRAGRSKCAALDGVLR